MKELGLLSPCLVIAAALLASCSSVREERGTSVEHGAFLFGDKSASPSAANLYTCATCHSTAPTAQRILPGAMLAGASERTAFWGGSVLDLLEAINACRTRFMDASPRWTDADEDAKAMYAFLRSLPPESTANVAFTVPKTIGDVPVGDAARGAALFDRACTRCHGPAHTGAGRLSEKVPRLPEDTKADPVHAGYTPAQLRLVFIQKVRHGTFFGYGGVMPPFSKETLSDEQLGDVLAHLGL